MGSTCALKESVNGQTVTVECDDLKLSSSCCSAMNDMLSGKQPDQSACDQADATSFQDFQKKFQADKGKVPHCKASAETGALLAAHMPKVEPERPASRGDVVAMAGGLTVM